MAEILSGKEVAAALNERMAADVEACKAQGVTPTLAILRVGERADDISYEKGATKRAEGVGVAIKNVVLPGDCDQATLMAAIDDLNKDESVHGVLMFRPLPDQLDQQAACDALVPEKDVDCMTEGSLAGVFANTGRGYPPCTAQACMEILDHFNIDTVGKKAVVIGRSLVVGKPAAMMLLERSRSATVTVCHTKTVDMPSVVREAEIVIVAAGKAEMITGDYFSPGQIVIDVGINWDDEKGCLVGDAKFDEAEPIVKAITPVPGGVGTVTTSVLVSHVVDAAKKVAGIE